MAISVKANQITGPTGTGNFSTTDPGFQPKALIIFGGLNSTTGSQVDSHYSLGFGDSSAGEVSAGFNSDDAVASSDAVRHFRTAQMNAFYTAGTVTGRLIYTLSSMDASGFTLNFGTLSTASSVLTNYLAIGGDDITNTKIGYFTSNTSTGNQSVSGVGFQPDIVFFFATLSTADGRANNNSNYTMGVMTSSAQWSVGTKNQNGQATTNTSRLFYDSACISLPSTTTDAVYHQASYVSMDSDGFTINHGTAGTVGFLIGYLAIKGGQWKVGTDTQKTSTGTKATTGVGFTPSGLFLSSVGAATLNGNSTDSKLCVGVTSGASNNVSHWVGDVDNSADAIAKGYVSNNKCLVMATLDASGPTVSAEADLDSFDSDGFTLDWTTADATARYFGYVAVGANVVVSSSVKDIICSGIIPFTR